VKFVGESSLGASIFVDDDLDNPRLAASKCPVCGDVRFPARSLCPNDLEECDPFEASGPGTVYEAVLILLAPQGFEAPYWVGYVDLDDGLRVFGQILHSPPDAVPTHGDRVEMSVGPLGVGDHAALGPRFRRVCRDAT
jgi:uncharacterized OB-fold protein